MDKEIKKDNYILFRLVPTMKCNYRCSYCFVPGQDKATQTTVFDEHPADEWVKAMENFKNYDVEFYCWGGEPFIIDGTYDIVKGWTEYDHVISGNRIDTNMSFTDKIAERCPTDKMKLNCSWHMQYDSLDSIYAKVKKLNDLGMVGMMNFVASRANLKELQDKYSMTPDDLIKKFAEIGVFVNIAADFSLVNGQRQEDYEEYKRMILQYQSPEDWKQLRCEKSACLCEANHHFFTIHANGDITPCIGGQVVGNFFEGKLNFPKLEVCSKMCPSLVAYPFRTDNNFPIMRHLPEYINRCKVHREAIGRDTSATYHEVKIPVIAPRNDESAPRVSVVLPTYNQISLLPRAVESILSQTYSDFELIIVNDGSTDGTKEYLDNLSDSRIRVIHQENKKLPSALNTGFANSKGELLTWVSSDNYCAPEFLEAFVSALDANPDAGLAYSAFAWVDENGKEVLVTRNQNLSYHAMLSRNQGMASFMYRRECHETVGLYDTTLEGAEDWDMWLRIIEQFPTVYVPNVLYYYSVHDASMTRRIPDKIRTACRQAFDKALARRSEEIDLVQLYPAIAMCEEKQTAAFHACLDFGTRLLQSPFDTKKEAIQFLEAAVSMAPESIEAITNLTLAYAKAGLMKEAVQIAQQLSIIEDKNVKAIAATIIEAAEKGSDMSAGVPVLQVDRRQVELFQIEEKMRRSYLFETAKAPKPADSECVFALANGEGITQNYPRLIHFLMIDKCNAKCVMCGGDYFHNDGRRRITLDKFKQMAANLHLEHVGGIVLAGAGDPFINPDTIEIVKWVNKTYPNLSVSFTTNGIGMTREVSEKLMECNVNDINISINSGTRETYKRMMQVNAFDRVCKNARDFIDIRKKKGKGAILQFSSAINRLNIEELPAMVELAHEIGLDSINLMYCRFYPQDLRDMNLDKQENRLLDKHSLFFHQKLSDEMVTKAKALAQRYGVAFTHEPLFSENAPARPCVWTEAVFMVGFDGEIYPCGGSEVHMKQKVESGAYNFGNALTQPLEEFWNGTLYRALRSSSKQNGKCHVSECDCCANLMKPSDLRCHMMHWDPESYTTDQVKRSIEAKQKDKPEVIKSENPTFSVIVPTYNRPDMLRDAISSILEQSYQDFEVIVVNDAGKDVGDVLKSFNDPRISYISHETNKGLAASRNTGIRAASGKYIALLDDDDAFFAHHLETALEHLSVDTPAIYTDHVRATFKNENGDYKLVEQQVPYSMDYDRNKLLLANISPVNTFVFERELGIQAGLFDESLSTLEDWDFWIRLSALKSLKHVPIATVQVNWRTDGTTMTSSRGAEFRANREKVYAKNQSEIAKIPNKDEILREFNAIWKADSGIEQKVASIIILTRNGLDYTKRCIESIERNTDYPHELVLVDNASTDGTVEYLKQVAASYPNCKLILNNRNLGYAGGNNKGIAAASGDYIVVMNNDVVVSKGWLSRMVMYADALPDVGIIGPRTNNISGTQKLDCVDYDQQTLLGFDRFADAHAQANAKQATLVWRLVGFCMLVKRHVIDKIGGFDTRFGRGNFEDDDFCIRAGIAGIKCVTAEEVFVHHFGSITFNNERVNYREQLLNNWEIFKDKWKLPSSLGYGDSFDISMVLNRPFDHNAHYCKLDANMSTSVEHKTRPVAQSTHIEHSKKKWQIAEAISAVDSALESVENGSANSEIYKSLCELKTVLKLLKPSGNKKQRKKQAKPGMPSQKDIDQRLQQINTILSNIPAESTHTTSTTDNISSSRPKLSLCMMVKDEERFLADCLKSVQDVVNEMVILDTGSTDRTKEIAQSFGAKVYDYEWNDNYSAARNAAIEHATGEWILHMDADERLEPKSKHKLLEALDIKAGEAYELIFYNYNSDNPKPDIVHKVVRVHRNKPTYRFEGRIHENIVPSISRANGAIGVLDDVIVHHYGYHPDIIAERNKHQRYVDLLLKDLEDRPGDVYVLHHLSAAYCSENKFAEALPYVAEAARLVKPDHSFAARIYARFAHCLWYLDKDQEALEVIERAENLGLRHPEITLTKANVLRTLGRKHDAIAEYEEAVRMGAERKWAGDLASVGYKAWFGIAATYGEMGELAKSAEAASKVVEEKPDHPQAHELLAKAYEKLNQYENAITHWQKVRKAIPESTEPIERLMSLYFGLQKYAEAKSCAEELLARGCETSELRISIGNCLEASGDSDAAVAEYKKAMKLMPADARPYVEIGRVHANQGKLQEALEAFSKAVELDNTCANAYFSAGDVLYAVGQYQQAADVYQSGLLYAPKHAPAFFTLGNCYFQMGAYEAAAAAYTQALQLDSNYHDAQSNLSLAEAEAAKQAA